MLDALGSDAFMIKFIFGLGLEFTLKSHEAKVMALFLSFGSLFF